LSFLGYGLWRYRIPQSGKHGVHRLDKAGRGGGEGVIRTMPDKKGEIVTTSRFPLFIGGFPACKSLPYFTKTIEPPVWYNPFSNHWPLF
jgi:hypothetical protein